MRREYARATASIVGTSSALRGVGSKGGSAWWEEDRMTEEKVD